MARLRLGHKGGEEYEISYEEDRDGRCLRRRRRIRLIIIVKTVTH